MKKDSREKREEENKRDMVCMVSSSECFKKDLKEIGYSERYFERSDIARLGINPTLLARNGLLG